MQYDPLDLTLNNYYNQDGKNVTRWVEKNITSLSLLPPKKKRLGYDYQIKSVLKHGVLPEVLDRHIWIWGTPRY